MRQRLKPVAGRVVRPAKNGKTKIIRARARWSDKAEAIFLEDLAATCNVRAAAAAAGFSTTAIYRRRMHDPGFAAAWQAALEQGYARLETRLVELATASLRTIRIRGDRPPPVVSVADAMNLLKLHRASVRGGPPQRYDARARPPDIEKVRANILRKIAAVERAAGRGE